MNESTHVDALKLPNRDVKDVGQLDGYGIIQNGSRSVADLAALNHYHSLTVGNITLNKLGDLATITEDEEELTPRSWLMGESGPSLFAATHRAFRACSSFSPLATLMSANTHLMLEQVIRVRSC
jgi:hypothetical protein